jgi:uncharacterized protein YhaN
MIAQDQKCYNWCQEWDHVRHLGMTTTRTQAVDEKLAATVAMLESQQGIQELLARTSELSEQQRRYHGRDGRVAGDSDGRG